MKVFRVIAAFLCWTAGSLPAQPEGVTIVYTSEAAPYVEALDGMRASLQNAPLVTVDLHSPASGQALARLLGTGPSHLVITVGREALEQVSARKTPALLVATMIMRDELDRVRNVSAAVHLDVPVADILGELKAMFPGKTRVAIIRNPAQPGQVNNSVVARGRQQGFSVRVVNARNPEELIRVVQGLNGQVDFVVCLPDSNLYNGTTVKPLILASLESQLLIVGFSASFVRAGAGVGVYPDFRDIGAQAGEVAQKELAGQSVASDQGPRKVVVGVNQRVIHLLGLEYLPRRTGETVTFK